MKKWSIQVFFVSRDDDGKPFRAKTIIHVEAQDISEAYRVAESSLKGREGVKLGAIIPGHHTRF